MLPVIALVGRPNVGKSTLFNYLTRTRDALVADQPGLTRDRKYGRGVIGSMPYLVVDTGGLSGAEEGIDELMAQQTRLAIGEADVVLLLVDGRQGLTPMDVEIGALLRRHGKPVYVVVNKSEGMDPALVAGDFFSLGFGEPLAIAAAHGRGMDSLMGTVLANFEAPAQAEPAETADETKVAIVGRPNVGKSTLVNRLLGEERVLAYDLPGTTRDSIFIPFEHRGGRYTLIDTAGIRRRARVSEAVERFSVIKAMQAIEAAHVVILVLDAQQGISEQDATLLGQVLDSGRALLVAVNKWDGLSADQRERVRSELQRRLSFVDFAEMHFISARHGTGIGHLFEAVDRAFESAMRDLSTSELTRVLERAIEAHQPPLVRGRRIKLRYAHQGGRNPPVVIIHGNQTEAVPDSYKRYLVNQYRTALRLRGTPLRIEFKSGANPYAGRRNELSGRQIARKKRLVKHVKKHSRRS